MSTVGDRTEAARSRSQIDEEVVKVLGDRTLSFSELSRDFHAARPGEPMEKTKDLLRDAIWRLADHGVIDIDWDRRLKKHVKHVKHVR